MCRINPLSLRERAGVRWAKKQTREIIQNKCGEKYKYNIQPIDLRMNEQIRFSRYRGSAERNKNVRIKKKI
jgi:hypothetical protein